MAGMNLAKKDMAWVKSLGDCGARQERAQEFLLAMIQSAPLCDRTKIDKKKWARIAFEWADAFESVSAKQKR